MIAMIKAMGSEPTFCTDYKRIYYCPEFAEECSREDKQFIICHEINHCAFLHNIRKGNRQDKRWNFATDYSINSILYKEFKFIPKDGLYDKKFENMSAEEIYNKLPEMNEDWGIFENGNVKIEIDKDGNIKVNGMPAKLLDTHMPATGSKDEMDEIEKEWTINVARAYNIAKMVGNLPAGMNIFIEKLMESKLDWRNMMRQVVIPNAKSDFSWNRPNRRHMHDDLYMPSMTGESLGVIALIVDVSGSTGGEPQLQFLSEANGLLQQYEVTMHLITCDVEITSHEVYEQGDTIKKEYKGMGGTSMENAFKYILEKGLNPNLVVCLTDGWTDLDFKSKFPTLWVVTKDGVELDKIKFGMKVKMEE